MTNPTSQLVDRYLAAWNETDGKRRRELVGETFAEGATYHDPAQEGRGRNGIDTMIAAAQARFPGMRFARIGEADTHNDSVRFRWSLSPVGGDWLVEGTDFATIVGGRFASVTGFFDKLRRGRGLARPSRPLITGRAGNLRSGGGGSGCRQTRPAGPRLPTQEGGCHAQLRRCPHADRHREPCDRRVSETDRRDVDALRGRFLVHGGTVEVIEGTWPGHLIVIEFPDGERMRAWYASPAYREILPLRTGNSESDVVFVEGVGADHRATDVLSG